MKKLVIASLLCASWLALSLQAHALDLTLGETQLHFTDWEMGTNWAPNQAGGFTALNWTGGTPAMNDGLEDRWGVASLSDITIPQHDQSNPADSVLSSISSGESLEAYFYGLDDCNASGSTTGTVNSLSVESTSVAGGAYVELYLDETGQYGIPFNPYVEGTYPNDAGKIINGGTKNVGNITDGQLVLKLQFVPYYDYANDIVYSNSYQFDTSTGAFVYGSSAGYLAVVGGTWAPYFDSNFYDTQYAGADVYFTNQFDTSTSPGNWTVKTKGATANPVPEPATMLLFGTGLAGLAGTRRRRKKNA